MVLNPSSLCSFQQKDRQMPIYEDRNGELVPFTKLNPGPDLYEKEIEQLVWKDLEAFTAEPLFPVARQAHIPGGGIPDILALDATGRVVVIEVKRDVDRNQLAQCLEYAGWARLTNLDEIAGLYDAGVAEHRGVEAFFKDWQDFTETTTPRTIQSQPRLILIARDFHGRTRSALDFLQESHFPVTIVPVSIYQDESGRRIIDIEGDHEPLTPASTGPTGPQQFVASVHLVTMTDLLQAGLILPNDEVEFVRPRLGNLYRAKILSDGQIQIENGTICRTPSRAAMQAANIASYDGWYAWRVKRLGGTKLHELREQFIAISEPQL
jgi:hypothetical protein